MRKLLFGLGILVVFLVVGVSAGLLFVPTDSIKADIAEKVERATGRTLSINGKLSFRVLPTPGISVDDVVLSNASQSGDTSMVLLEGATVEIALLPLISGNLQINRIILRKPNILLEQYADGTNNWTFEPQAEATRGAEADADLTGELGSGTPPIRFDDVVIVDGTLSYKTPDQIEKVENIDVSFGAATMLGPFRAEGSLMLRGFDISLNAAVGELVLDKATPINLRVTAAGAKIGYSGVLSGSIGTPRVSGQIEVRADDLSTMIGSVFGGTPPSALRGKALELNGIVTATQEAVTVKDLALRIGDDSATGAIDIVVGKDLSANVVLNVSQLDLDRLLADTKSIVGESQPSGLAEKSVAAVNPSGATSADGFVIPKNISASLVTKIDTLVYRDGVVREVFLNVEVAEGAVNISRASAELPGGSSASLVGLVSPTEAGPKFDGQAEVSSDNLRSLLKWAGADVSAVPAERLRKMEGSVTVSGTQENITLTDIDVSVDVSRLRGGVAIALRERPGFGIGLSLDKINVDAYLPKQNSSEALATGSNAQARENDAGAIKPSERIFKKSDGFAALNGFDAILQLKVGELVYRTQKMRGINLDSTLQAGMLEVRDASVANLEGAKVSAKGRIEGLVGAPKADLWINIDAPNVDKLLSLANVAAPTSIGPGKLSGTFRGDMQNLIVDTSLQAFGANLKVKGTVAAMALPPRYDLNFDLKHGDASAFFGRLGEDRATSAVKTVPLTGLVNARGNLNSSAIDANIGIGRGKIIIDGKVDNLAVGAPTGVLTLSVDHPDMVAFVRTFANDYKPALAGAGPFALKASIDMQPKLISLQKLEGRAGPVSYSGNAQVNLGGERPDLMVELKTSEIIVDWFLPVSSPNKQAGKGSGGAKVLGSVAKASGAERWSRERLDLSALQVVNADIKLSAPAITYTDIRVDQPQLAVTVRNGVLDVKQLSGKAFGGEFSMTAQVADSEVPTMRYALDVEGTDAAKFLGGASKNGDKGVLSALVLLFPVSNVKLVSGTLGADLNVASLGRSEFEMISNLGGKGVVQFSNAVVDGVDMCRISNQLGNLNGLQGFLGLATSARGGQTKIASFDGRFDITNGVASLPPQQLNAECAAVVFSGTTNLPEWLVDIRAKAGFPAHPKFQGLTVEQKGSLGAPNTRLVNLNQINDFVVSKAVGTVLRKLLRGGGQQQPSSGGSTEQPQSQPSGDPFKNLLEGLIKRR
ncbi:MAG: AsmA family protein [Alphaproteobacteria bacterium]|nr:AsmA family protein [Alphaproteobacteria bacterium]